MSYRAIQTCINEKNSPLTIVGREETNLFVFMQLCFSVCPIIVPTALCHARRIVLLCIWRNWKPSFQLRVFVSASVLLCVCQCLLADLRWRLLNAVSELSFISCFAMSFSRAQKTRISCSSSSSKKATVYALSKLVYMICKCVEGVCVRITVFIE